jgi:dipeptidyl aminopeptidase/acylaminoacyl peptidase
MRRFLSRRRLAIAAALALVLVLLAGSAYMVAGYVVYDRSTRVDAQCGGRFVGSTPASFTAEELDATPYLMPSYEEVAFESRGDPDVRISGWWVAGAATDGPTVVVVHGLNSCKRSPTVLLPAGMLHRAGYNVLLIDLRNEGDSTVTNGRFAGGVLEYKDVLGAWDWVRKVKGVPSGRIGLLGMSMGAASALIAMGQEPAVAAVWEDSSFSDINVAISDEVARNGFPTFLAPAAIMVGRLEGVDITAMGPLDAVARLNGRPIAIVHGTADTRMPVKHAYALIQAVKDHGGDPYTWLVDGVDHTRAVYAQPVEYESRLAEFFGPAIGVSATTTAQPRPATAAQGLLAA